MELPDSLTNKIGPLPVWGWALAGVGGYLVATRVLGRGGSSSVTDSGSNSVVGATGVDNGIEQTLQSAISQIGSIQTIEQLLVALNTNINKRASLLNSRQTLLDKLAYLKAHKGTKAQIAAVQKQLDANKTAISSVDKVIADIQAKITSAQASVTTASA